MSTFHLKISTPDGLQFDGEVERLRVRMIDGDVCLLARHIDYVSAVGMGEAAVTLADGSIRRAACIGYNIFNAIFYRKRFQFFYKTSNRYNCIFSIIRYIQIADVLVYVNWQIF